MAGSKILNKTLHFIIETKQRYQEQIFKGEKKRSPVVIDQDESKKAYHICAAKGVNKTDFMNRAI